MGLAFKPYRMAIEGNLSYGLILKGRSHITSAHEWPMIVIETPRPVARPVRRSTASLHPDTREEGYSSRCFSHRARAFEALLRVRTDVSKISRSRRLQLFGETEIRSHNLWKRWLCDRALASISMRFCRAIPSCIHRPKSPRGPCPREK